MKNFPNKDQKISQISIKSNNSNTKSSKPRKRSPTWLQLQTLIFLSEKDLYGLELRDLFENLGIKLSPGQIYPMLSKLFENGLVTMHEEASGHHPRKVYSITEKGQEEISWAAQPFIKYLEVVIAKYLDLIKNELLEQLEIERGMIVADFSNKYSEWWAQLLQPSLDITGRFYFCRQKNEIERIHKRIEGKIHSRQFFVLEGSPEEFPLPENSVDRCMALLSFHEAPDNEIVIAEMLRVLKRDGKLVICDVIDVEHIMFATLASLLPDHKQIGTKPELIKQSLRDKGFQITGYSEHNGIFVLSAQLKANN
ncbi:MAG: helix-turn-helix transcriptional regulator [Candidatus Hermodarchaeota archaeon]